MKQKKIVKKGKKIIKTRLFSLFFACVFIISLFMNMVALAQSEPFELKEVTLSDKSSDVTSKITKVDDDEMVNSITFHKLNANVTYKAIIKNNLKKQITILSITDDNKNSYVDYQYDKHEKEKIKANGTLDFYVKVLYKKELTDVTKREQTNSVKFTIKYLEQGKEKEKKSTINNNPNTGDNISLSFALLCVSATGLVVCLILDKKKKDNKLSKASMFIIAGILFVPIVIKAATYSYDFIFDTKIGLYDKMVVTYVIDGKEKTLTIPYNELVTGLTTPEKDGYTFNKWVKEDGTDFDPSKPITKDTKIIAKFNVNTYQISYDLDGGTTATPNPTTYTINDKITLVEPTKEHYVFKGWIGTDLTTPTKNVVIDKKIGDRSYTAKYEPKNYTITYNGLTAAEKATLNNPTSYNIESSSFTLNNPTTRVDGDGDPEYTFSGWKENETISTTITLPNLSSMGNKTFEAIWTEVDPTVYTISYELNGGTVATANPVEFTKKTETFTLNNPTKTGYTFKGWSGTDLTGDENTEVKVVKGTKKNLSFEAHYTANTYTVKFDKNAETATGTMSNQTFTYDTSSKLNDVSYTRPGYTFDSWNTKEDGTGTSYENKADILNLLTEGQITLYAQWAPNSYEIEFDGNNQDATGTMSNLSMVYDESKTLTLNAYSLEGYTFDSWNTKADGSGDSFVNGASVKNLATSGTTKLYAQWIPNTNTSYKIEHYQENADDNGYTIFETDYLTGTTNTEATATAKTYANFSYESDNPNNVMTGNIASDGSLTLKVYYKRSVYTVTFDSNGGKDVPSISKKYKATLAYSDLPTAEKKHNAFQGWYTESEAGEKITNDMIIDSDVTLYAHWELVTLCKKATTLHTTTCQRNDSSGCHTDGYYATGSMGSTTIVYGNTPGTTLTAGDAYDCDINADGEYNAANERFYYVRTTNDNKAVLVFYSNFEGEGGVQTVDNYDYETAVTKLPTLEQWTNADSVYDDEYGARLLQVDDIIAACGISAPDTSERLTECDYLLENTSYEMDDTTIVRSGIWTEKVGNSYHRIQSASLSLETKTHTSKNVARPTIEVPMSLMDNDQLNEYTVTFDSQGGSFESDPSTSILVMNVNEGSAIRKLPIPSKTGATFDGWYIDAMYSERVTQPVIINSDKTYYAKWISSEYAAMIGTTGYNTLQEAVTAVPTSGSSPTTILLMKDVQEKVTIIGNRNIKLNLQHNTVSNSDNNNVFVVTNGKFEIYNGNLASDASTNGLINVSSNGTLNVHDITINVSGERQAIYNDGGAVTISDGSNITAVASARSAVHNKSDGTVTILGGTITSTNLYGVYNESGTLIIGQKDGDIDTTTPIIQGKTYGVVAYDDYKFYDGTIKGQTAPVGIASSTGNTPTVTTDTNETKIIEIEDNSEKINDQDGTYKTLYLQSLGERHKIILDPRGGNVSTTSIYVEYGNPVGTLPTPTKGVYTFDGWFDEATDQEVNSLTVPDGDKTYYAKWSYTPSHTEFNIINDPMRAYYNNIATWKNNESTFQSNMDANFNQYDCQACDATASNPYQSCPIAAVANKAQCDRPKGFETGLTGGVSVYTSNETTKEKGTKVNYVTVTNGTIYNMIPGQTYYWESDDDPNIYGTVKVLGERRIVDAGAVRNVRDLGGLEVDTNGDGTVDGTLKYGKIFRGVRLDTSADITSLETLGITEEIDLRGSQSDPKLSNYVPISITNYEIDKANFPSNYTALRNALIRAMNDVIDGENIFFHCKIGTDRTGTFAYFLEGLLGVSEEDRLQDYELSYFYGVLNRHRFYSYQPGSSITHRFDYMHNLYPTNSDIYDWFMLGSTDQEADAALINQFRSAMIDN